MGALTPPTLAAALGTLLTSPASTAHVLDALLAADQAARQTPQTTDDDEVSALGTAVVHTLFAEGPGWPTAARTGPGGPTTLWLLVQHSHDLSLMNDAVQRLPTAVARGEVDAAKLAVLTDRVAVFQLQPQTYGSQFAEVDGVLRPMPLLSPSDVDTRRAQVGLPPLADYAASLADGAPVSLTPAPEVPAPIRRILCANVGGPACGVTP